MKEALLSLQNICVSYGSEEILKNVSLSLVPGEILGIRGENGAGKSTLMKIIAGVIRPDSGTRNADASLKDKLSYVPQEIALYPTLTGRQNLSFWAEVYGIRGSAKQKRIKYLLNLMNLEDKANKRVETYSGGMKRRLNMAASLAITPAMLLLDEPTVGADTRSVNVMIDSILRMRDNGCSIVLISHADIDMETVCDRIVTMERGVITDEKILRKEEDNADNSVEPSSEQEKNRTADQEE